MQKQYFEIVPYSVFVDAGYIADTYNTADKLSAIATYMGYTPVVGDPVTAFGVRGTAANAYCQARMVSFVVATDLICVMSFGSSSTCSNSAGCVTNQLEDKYKLNLYVTLIYVGSNKWGYKVAEIRGLNGNNNITSVCDSYALRGIWVYKGNNSVALSGRSITYDYPTGSTYDAWYTIGCRGLVFTKYIHNNTDKFMLVKCNGSLDCSGVFVVDDNSGLVEGTNGYSVITDQYKQQGSVLVKCVFNTDNAEVNNCVNNFVFYGGSDERGDLLMNGSIRIINGEYYYCNAIASGGINHTRLITLGICQYSAIRL